MVENTNTLESFASQVGDSQLNEDSLLITDQKPEITI